MGKTLNILVLTNHYLPGWRAGGPIQSVKNLVESLSNVATFHIITQDHDFQQHEKFPLPTNTWRPQGSAQVWYTTGTPCAWLKSLYIAPRQMKAPCDIVHVQSLFAWRAGLLPLFLHRFIGWQKNAQWVVHPRGELNTGALGKKNCKKQIAIRCIKMLGILKGVTMQATNDDERKAIQSVFPSTHIYTAANLATALPKQPLQKPDQSQKSFLFCGRITPQKGLDTLLKALQHVTSPLTLTLVGPREENAAYLEEIDALIANMPNHIKILQTGGLPPMDVAKEMQKAHALILPTHGENFGHVIVEAAAHGCIPLISNKTPWHGLEQAGGFIHPVEDEHTLAKHIETVCAMSFVTFTQHQQQVFDFYQTHPLIQRAQKDHIAMYQDLTK